MLLFLLLAPAAAVCQVVIRKREIGVETEDWICPKKLNAPNQQELVQKDLHQYLLSPLSSVGWLKGLGWNKGWKGGRRTQ